MLKRTIFIFLIFTNLVYSFSPITPQGCGETKGCLRPSTCPDTKICDYLATWKSVSDMGTNYVEFELVGKLQKPDGFIYMKFSDDKAEGDDGVVGCYRNSNTGRVDFKVGYIDSMNQNRFYDQSDPPKNVDDSENQTEAEPKNLLIKDGENLGGSLSGSNILECRFRRLMTPTSDVNIIKDLSPENAYHIGVYRGSRVQSDGFGPVDVGGAAFSSEKKSLSSPIYGSYTDQQNSRIGFAKAHGMIMVLAWVFCASVGTIISRYYKNMMPNKAIINEPLWFQAHRILMGISVGLTILGVILIIVYCQGYSKVRSWPHYVHPILGFIVLALALINPFVALFRCRPNSPKRAWHNWIHFLIGIICFCLSFIQMFLGLRMTGAGHLLASKDEPISLLIFFVIFQFCVEIILEIHGCIYFRRNEEKYRIYQENKAQHLNDERIARRTNFDDVVPEPSGRVFKYFMLGLHITVASIVTVVLMIMIAVY